MFYRHILGVEAEVKRLPCGTIVPANEGEPPAPRVASL